MNPPRVIGKIAEEFRNLNYQVPRYQPFVGENAFTTAAGIHVDAQLRNPMTYLSMDPSIVGREARILIGPYSGRSSIAYWLRRRGVEPTPKLINAVYERVMRIYDDGLKREPLSDEELNKILNDVMMSQTMRS